MDALQSLANTQAICFNNDNIVHLESVLDGEGRKSTKSEPAISLMEKEKNSEIEALKNKINSLDMKLEKCLRDYDANLNQSPIVIPQAPIVSPQSPIVPPQAPITPSLHVNKRNHDQTPERQIPCHANKELHIPLDFYISIDEVENALKSVKSHSAAGPDKISPWLLRENSASLSRPLASIFNASIQEGNIPLLWKSANVSPLPKSSPALDIDSDFRPISLTTIVSKILESFPHSWLLRSVSGQIDNLQFGALKRSRSTMALLYMFHKWYEAMDTPGTCLRVCTLDFSKAFDRIDFNILLQKLINMGIHPVLINWIANFLTDRRQRTRIGPNYSCWRSINGGVPQGTKLGPLLFLIMVNDLKVSEDSVKFVDTTLWEIITSAQSSASVLPAQISECCSWVAKNNMKLNPTKTKEIRVCFSTYDTCMQLFLHLSLMAVTFLLCPMLNYSDYSSPKTSSGFFMLTLFVRKLRSVCMLYDY